FLENTCTELDHEKPTLSDEVWDIFMNYNWPGNIRELRNVSRRACLLTGKSGIIGKGVIPEQITTKDNINPQAIGVEVENFADLDLKSASMLAESKHIMETLDKVHYNKTLAAKMLNIDRKTLYS